MDPIKDTIQIDTPAKETVVKITPQIALDDLGLDPKEVAMAQKSGLVEKEASEDQKTKDAEAAAKKTEADEAAKKAEADKAAAAAGDKKPAKFEPKPWEKDVPDEEKANVDKFSQNEKALYWKQKKEKYSRQQAESARDKARIEAAFWKGKAEAATTAPKLEVIKPDAKKDDTDFLDEEYPDKGKENGAGKDKPLTRSDLDKIEEEKVAATKKAEEARQARVAEITVKLDEQEKEFKVDHEDYDQVYESTKAILDVAHDDKKLAEIFPDRIQRRAAKSLAQELVAKMVNPERVQPGDANAAELAYELGKLHPKASNAGEDDQDEPGKNGDEDQQAAALKQRLEKQSRQSSAPLSGGGTRQMKTLADVTAEDVVNMSDSAYAAFKKKYPERAEELLRETTN